MARNPFEDIAKVHPNALKMQPSHAPVEPIPTPRTPDEIASAPPGPAVNSFTPPTAASLENPGTMMPSHAQPPQVFNPTTGVVNPEYHLGGTQFQMGPQIPFASPASAMPATTPANAFDPSTIPDPTGVDRVTFTPETAMTVPNTGAVAATPQGSFSYVGAGPATKQRPTFEDEFARFLKMGGTGGSFISANIRQRFASGLAAQNIASMHKNDEAARADLKLDADLSKADVDIQKVQKDMQLIDRQMQKIDSEIAKNNRGTDLSATDWDKMTFDIKPVTDPNSFEQIGVQIGGGIVTGPEYQTIRTEYLNQLDAVNKDPRYANAPDTFKDSQAWMNAYRAYMESLNPTSGTANAEKALGGA